VRVRERERERERAHRSCMQCCAGGTAAENGMVGLYELCTNEVHSFSRYLWPLLATNEYGAHS